MTGFLARVQHRMLHLHSFALILLVLLCVKLKLVAYLYFVVYPLVSVEKLIWLVASKYENSIF